MKKIAFTSISSNYLPKARVLGHSIKRYVSDVRFILVLAEALDASVLRPTDPFDEIITVHDLAVPEPESWLFSHTVVEACTAIKGRALTRLLQTEADTAVLYFDPDIVVTHCLQDLYAHFDEASVLLTPHGVEPEETREAIIDNEISHLRYGVYNLGFLGVRNTAAGTAFARWWAARLEDYCYDNIDQGLFTDQRWVDLAPAFFQGVMVLRDPGYNVATWNLTHRFVKGSVDKGFIVNGRPMVFYHFSGFDSGAQEIMLAKYGARSPALKAFRRWYIRECRRMGQDRLASVPWSYSRFNNGLLITSAQRCLYRHRKDLQEAFPDPFSVDDPGHSFLGWYTQNREWTGEVVAVKKAPYRVLIMALDDDCDSEASLRQLIGKTAARDAIELVASRRNCKRLAKAIPAGSKVVELEQGDASRTGRESWMLGQLAGATAEDVIFVQLGLELPDLWDLRLEWAATREHATVTASPMYNGTPLTRLLPVGAECDFGLDLAGMDQRLFNLDHHIAVDAPSFLYECCYVRSANASRAFAGHGEGYDGLRPSLADFARRCTRAGFAHVIANDLLIAKPAGAPHRDLAARHSEPGLDVYCDRNVFHETCKRFKEIAAVADYEAPTVCQRGARRHLHVMHAWGGGLEHWVRSFCRSDVDHVNMILKPFGSVGEFGSGLELYSDMNAPTPMARWLLPIPIKATTPFNVTYRRIIESVLEDFGIDVVLVSSLIGHSMDILRTGFKTLFICHDFFPLTPDVYIRSRHLCGSRVAAFSIDELFARGPLAFFPNLSRAEAKDASQAFRTILSSRMLKLVAPSASTRQIFLDLARELDPKDITVIAHGTPRHFLAAGPVPFEAKGKLRVVVPGRSTPEKGSVLLGRILPRLARFADVLLVGCGLEGQHLADIPGVQAISRYQQDELPRILKDFRPHLGLLLSDFPETFSYVLDELFALAIPTAALPIGSFAERIVDGVNGFLVDNNPHAVLQLMHTLDDDRTSLTKVRRTLETARPRTETDMVQDYERLLALPRFSGRALFARPLPLTTCARLARGMARQLQLTEAAGPIVRAACDDYCRVNAKEIFLHPPMPGLPDTEILFPAIPLAGPSTLTADVILENERAPQVAVSVVAEDNKTGKVLGAATVITSHSMPATLNLKLDCAATHADIRFRSRVGEGETCNDFAWLKVRHPIVAQEG